MMICYVIYNVFVYVIFLYWFYCIVYCLWFDDLFFIISIVFIVFIVFIVILLINPSIHPVRPKSFIYLALTAADAEAAAILAAVEKWGDMKR